MSYVYLHDSSKQARDDDTWQWGGATPQKSGWVYGVDEIF